MHAECTGQLVRRVADQREFRLADGSGAGPAEIGGAISLSNATTGETVIGGFIGRKQ
jgi:hypothetical protein